MRVIIPRKKSRVDKAKVYAGTKKRTASNLKKKDLIMNRHGRIVNRKRFLSEIPVSQQMMYYPRSIPKSYKKYFNKITITKKEDPFKSSKKEKEQQRQLYDALKKLKNRSNKDYYRLAEHIMKRNVATGKQKQKIIRRLKKII